jgi:uncharacterized Zn ribbon protein
MPRGQKTCDNCGHCTGPRAFVCPSCNTQFVFNVKSREQKNTKVVKNINWKELESGDMIKVSGGSYYMKGGEFIPMGYRGKFKVINLDDNGIVAHSSKGGFCHIYMGRDQQCPETKIWKVKHKIAKLKRKMQDNQ